MRRIVIVFAFAVLSLVVATSALAQEACSAFVDQALAQMNDACRDMARNSACYGYNSVAADFFAAAAPQSFAQANDRADLAALQSITTAPLDPATQLWGIAVIKAQANLPDTMPGQSVTFLLLGDVQLKTGVTPGSDMKPMQAVYFTTGIGQSKCTDAPPSALVIQGPQNMTVDLSVNGANIKLGSTAVFTTSEDQSSMSCGVLDGAAHIGKDGLVIPAGFSARVPLDKDLNISGGWGVPAADDDALEFDVLKALPEGYLNYVPDIPTAQEVDMLGALDPALTAAMEPHRLREMVRLLIAEGATPEMISLLNVSNLQLFILNSAGKLDAEAAQTFNAEVQLNILNALTEFQNPTPAEPPTDAAPLPTVAASSGY